MLYAVLASGQLYYGSAITCWVPTHFHGSWTKFTNNLCWVNDTYYLPLHDDHHIPKAHQIQEHQRIEYYQWIPFILLAQVTVRVPSFAHMYVHVSLTASLLHYYRM